MEKWSQPEVEATVSDYFAMLEAELREEPYNKAEHWRALLRILNGRTKGAIEKKHQNVSAVLIELGLPFINGYKPLGNYQQMLYEIVADRIPRTPSLLAAIAVDVARRSGIPGVRSILDVKVDPPKALRTKKYPIRGAEHPVPRIGVNYLALEAANRFLGDSGEEFVLQFERARLRSLDCGNLADRVERVSVTLGDGLGYDIRSFEKAGADRLIEVKTTKYGQGTPFFVSRNEVRVSQRLERVFHLYRVFSFRNDPGLFWRKGRIDQQFSLEPEVFEARVSASA